VTIDKALFRRVMGRFATGVTIVTARIGGECHGMTVNSFTSVSLEPTLVLVCIDRRARTHQFIVDSGAFAVNVLSEDQQSLAESFASRWQGTDRFAAVAHHPGVTGSPLIDGCLAYVDCRAVARHASGDHTIFIGEVVDAQLGAEGRPLLYYGSTYRRIAP